VLRNIFDEAAELAYFGASTSPQVLIRQGKNIPVRLKNTMNPEDEGTLITAGTIWEDYKAVAAKDGISVIRIKSDRMLMAYGFIRKVFEIFEAYKTPIDMVTTSEVSVSITVDNPSYLKQIEEDLRELGSVEVENDQSIICVVGDLRTDKSRFCPRYSKLRLNQLKMISYGASPTAFDTYDSKDKVQTQSSQPILSQ
jgi:aspartate kinase